MRHPRPDAVGGAVRRTAAKLSPAAAAAIAGALATLAHVHTEAWWLTLVALGVLGVGVMRAGPWGAFVQGWVFGTAWMGASTWWLFISLHRYGELAAPLAVVAVAALSMALSLYLGVVMAMVAACRTGRAWLDVPAFAAAWLLAELARGVLFTGFPWAAAGYAQVDGPLALLAPWVGVYGMGAVAALMGAAFGWMVVGRGALAAVASPISVAARVAESSAYGPATARAHGALRALPAALRAAPAALALLTLAALAWAPRTDFTSSSGRLRVSLVQTAVPQDEKFDLHRLPQLLGDLEQALATAQGDLVVAPETAVPVLPEDLPLSVWQALAAPFQGSGRALLLGLPLGNPSQGYTNSAAGWFDAPATAAAHPLEGAFRYDKHHLVPFGEFIPWGFRWFVDLMRIPLGDFNRGPLQAPAFEAAGQRIGPNICYEDLFGEELARRFMDPARAPTVLANLSNIAWFGPTIAIDQHLHISRLRTLELQRPMVRATNTGATAVIDHRGRVKAWLEPQRRGVLEGEVEGREGLTPYARWVGVWGLWPLALGALAWLGVATWVARGRGRGRASPT